MIYKIEGKTNRDWNGKPFVEAELVDEKGERFKVSAWAGEFNGVDAWDGELTKNDKGYWKLVNKKSAIINNAKTAQIEKAVERKEKSIAGFQDSKDWSIKVSSTMRDAVQLALAEVKDIRTLNTLEADILKWREWLWRHWDVSETQYPPF